MASPVCCRFNDRCQATANGHRLCLAELTSVSETGEGTRGGWGACSEVPARAVGITEQAGLGALKTGSGGLLLPETTPGKMAGAQVPVQKHFLTRPSGLWVLALRWWAGPQHLRPRPQVHAERLCAAC